MTKFIEKTSDSTEIRKEDYESGDEDEQIIVRGEDEKQTIINVIKDKKINILKLNYKFKKIRNLKNQNKKRINKSN